MEGYKFNIKDKVRIKKNIQEYADLIVLYPNGEIVTLLTDNYYLVDFFPKKEHRKPIRIVVHEDFLEEIKEEDSISDSQIWNMFIPKMKKIGIDPNGDGSVIKSGYLSFNEKKMMYLDNVKKLMAVVYRSGYVRGQKGRNFIIGTEKVEK